jgi:hypothetical protein
MDLIDTPWLILFISFTIVFILWFSTRNNNTSTLFNNEEVAIKNNNKDISLNASSSSSVSSMKSSFIPNSLSYYPSMVQPGQPSNVDQSRVAGDRLGPLDPAIYQPPTIAPSGAEPKPVYKNNLSISGQLTQPNKKDLEQLTPPRIPVDYLPLPYNPALPNCQTPNFTSENLRVDAFYKKQPLVIDGSIPKPILITQSGEEEIYQQTPGEQPPAYERGIKAGALSTSQYSTDYWLYQNEKIQNGGNWGGILGYEPNAAPEAAYPNGRIFPSTHGYYPNENPNSNRIGIPSLPSYKDDLRMGLGIPAYQGAFVNERTPM